MSSGACATLCVLIVSCRAERPRPPLPSPPEAQLASADLLADLGVLEDAYKTLHPGLTRYVTPAQLDAGFAVLETTFARERSLADAFLALTRFTATLRCGHSYPNFSNQPAAIAAALFERRRLPFLFRWLGDHMIITDGLGGDPRIARGTEIARVDGVPAAQILDRLMPLARADGSNDAKRRDDLSPRRGRYEAFDIYYSLAFAVMPTVTLDLVTPVGAKVTVTVPTQTAEQRRLAAPEQGQPAGGKPMWELKLIDATTGYLAMPDWTTYKTKWDWRADLQRTFETLDARGATGLVIDLRGNEGGEDVGNVIMQHLIDSDLPVRAMQRIVRYRTVPAALKPNLDTWDPSFFDWGEEAVGLDDGRFALVNQDARDDVIFPMAPRFRGRVVVLVDASNSSATFQFAALVQRQHLATLVGEPTGGNQRGINGGAFFFLRLPHTHLEVDLPLIGTFPPPGVSEPPDAGITPDRLVITTPASIASGVDVQLDAARALMRGSGATR